MQNLNEKCQSILEERDKVLKEIQSMQSMESTQKYLELQKKKGNLEEEYNQLYKEVKMEEYDSCEHILVIDAETTGYFDQNLHHCFGCIKCGLDTRVLDLPREELNYTLPQMQAMYDYLNKNQLNSYRLKGMRTYIECDIDLAKAIYTRIKNAHPTIDDETTLKYFEIALNDIRNIKVNGERKICRARRLSLNDHFNRWDACNIRDTYS